MNNTTLTITILSVLLIICDIKAQKDNETIPLLLWADEFDGAMLNAGAWTARIGNNDGWGNGELQYYTEQNVAVENGQYLSIAVLKESDTNGTVTFTSARIDTKDKVHVKYGTISASIQIPNVDAGLWPAFWTLGESNVVFPAMGEFDIMETGQGAAISEGQANNRVISGAHWEKNGTYATLAGSRNFDASLNGTFFVYTLNWTPTNITTYVNDDQVWTMDITPEGGCVDCEEFHQPHYMILNVAVGGGFTSFGGSSSNGSSSSSSSGCGSSSSSGSSGECGSLRTSDDITASLPTKMLVDWVRVYDNGNSSVSFTTSTVNPSVPEVVAPPSISPPSISPPTASVIGGGSGKGGKSGKGSGKGNNSDRSSSSSGSGKSGKGGKGDGRESNVEFALSDANAAAGTGFTTAAAAAAAACLVVAQLL